MSKNLFKRNKQDKKNKQGNGIVGKLRFVIIRIVITAMFIALGVIMKTLEIPLPVAGVANATKINFTGVFVMLSAIVSGPLIGVITGGAVDFVGFILTPDGGWIPWLTVTAALAGGVKGVLWKLFNWKKAVDSTEKGSWNSKGQIAYFGVFALITLVGVINIIFHYGFPGSGWAKTIAEIGSKNMEYFLYGVLLIGILGLITAVLSLFMSKNTIKVFVAMLVAGVLMTTLNTIILKEIYSWQTAFMIVYIPRLIFAVIMAMVQAYVVCAVLPIMRKMKVY